MTAAPLAPDVNPPRRRRQKYTFWWCLLGICAEALLFLLSTLSDACELPPPFKAMELKGVPKPYYEVGETIQYQCKKGYLYLLPFSMVATCEPNHTWVPISDDGCVKVECIKLQDPSFGHVHYIDGRVSWGSRAQFSCVEGYYVVGMSVLHCVLKGNDAYWNGPSPRCEKIYCLPPPKIKNGTHTFPDIDVFKYHEEVIYTCDNNPGPDKFSLVGISTLYCSGHNTWSSKPPECKGPKPTHPTKPPVYNYPGYPNPREGIFGQELDAWIIALIVITSIVGVAVIILIILRYLEYMKKGNVSAAK